MVPKGDPAREKALADDLESLDHVTGVTSYVTKAGQALPVEVAPESTVQQVISGGWSRFVVTLDVEGEGETAFSLVEQVRATVSNHYGDEGRLAGAEVSVYDLRDTVQEDSGRVKLFSMLSIGLVLALMFRSLSIPFVVLMAIEVAIWINLAVPYFLGESLNYIGYLVIDAVQLGAAVDYAIIYTREYFERRGPIPAARGGALGGEALGHHHPHIGFDPRLRRVGGVADRVERRDLGAGRAHRARGVRVHAHDVRVPAVAVQNVRLGHSAHVDGGCAFARASPIRSRKKELLMRKQDGARVVRAAVAMGLAGTLAMPGAAWRRTVRPALYLRRRTRSCT